MLAVLVFTVEVGIWGCGSEGLCGGEGAGVDGFEVEEGRGFDGGLFFASVVFPHLIFSRQLRGSEE